MIMSSFLMNSAPYVEPKFPPSEEYSQNNYIQTQNSDYYRSGTVQNYGYSHDARRYEDPGYTPNGGYSCGAGGAPNGMLPGDPQGGMSNQGYGAPPPAHQPQHQTPGGTAPNSAQQNGTQGTGQNLPPCSQGNSTSPVIYPWMKRVHMGSGK